MLIYTSSNALKAIKFVFIRLILFSAFIIFANYIVQIFHFDYIKLSLSMVVLLASAVSILLGFKLNISYTRWANAAANVNQLATCVRFILSSLTPYFKESLSTETIKQIQSIMFKQIAYLSLVRLELTEAKEEDYEREIWSRAINGQAIFSEPEVEILKKKDSKANYLLHSQIKSVNQLAVDNNAYPSFLNETIKVFYEIDKLSSTIRETKLIPFSWGYSFYTNMLVWSFPIIFSISDLNSDVYFRDIFVALICIIFITINNVANNLAFPFSNSFAAVPLRNIQLCHEKILLEDLNIPTDIVPFQIDEEGIID